MMGLFQNCEVVMCLAETQIDTQQQYFRQGIQTSTKKSFSVILIFPIFSREKLIFPYLKHFPHSVKNLHFLSGMLKKIAFEKQKQEATHSILFLETNFVNFEWVYKGKVIPSFHILVSATHTKNAEA